MSSIRPSHKLSADNDTAIHIREGWDSSDVVMCGLAPTRVMCAFKLYHPPCTKLTLEAKFSTFCAIASDDRTRYTQVRMCSVDAFLQRERHSMVVSY